MTLVHWIQLGLLPVNFPTPIWHQFQEELAHMCSTDEKKIAWLDDHLPEYLSNPWDSLHHHLSCLQCATGGVSPSQSQLKIVGPSGLCKILDQEGFQTVQIQIRLQDHMSSPVTWRLSVKSFRQFQIYPRKTLPAYTELALSDLTLKGVLRNTEIGYTADRVRDVLREIIGQKIKRPLPDYQTLKPEEFMIQTTLEKGHVVPLVWKKGDLELRRLGKLKRNSRIGDVVECEVVESTKVASPKMVLGVLVKDPDIKVLIP